MIDNPYEIFDDGRDFGESKPKSKRKRRERSKRVPKKRRRRQTNGWRGKVDNNNNTTNNSSGYKRNSEHYGGGGGKRKRKNKVKETPEVDTGLPVVLFFEQTVKPSVVSHSLPEAIRWCKINGYSLRVKAQQDIIDMCLEVDPTILVVNHWDGFGGMSCDMCPTQHEANLAKRIWSWLEKQKEVISTFRGTTIVSLLGNLHYGRAFALVTYTEDGSIDPNNLQEDYKYMEGVLELANMYKIPTINLARDTYMDDLQIALKTPNALVPPPKEQNYNYKR